MSAAPHIPFDTNAPYKPVLARTCTASCVQELCGEILSSLASALPSVQGPLYLCLRRGGIAIQTHWHETVDWKTSLVEALSSVFGNGKIALREGETLELALTHTYRPIPSARELPGGISRGIRGLTLRAAKKFQRYAPGEMIALNLSYSEATSRFMASLPAEHHSGLKLESFRALQFLLLPCREGVRIAAMYRGNQIVEADSVSQESSNACAALMGEWMRRHVHADGRLTYRYLPSEARAGTGNNMIRQFMGTLCLFRLARFSGQAADRLRAEKNLHYNLERFFRAEEDFGFIVEGEKIKLGGAALAALAIVESGMSGYEEQRDRLLRFTLKMWQEDGSFRTFYRPEGRNDCQNFYPGETLYYWAHEYRRNPSASLLERIAKSVAYYQEFHREQPNPAFIPWHTQAYFILWSETGDPLFRDAIFAMNDWLLPYQQWEGVKAKDAQGRFYDPEKPYGPPHASSTGVYLEGLADAWALAHKLGDHSRAAAYARVMRRAIRNIMQLQFVNDVDLFYAPEKEKTLGSIRTTEYDNRIRVDNVQHNLMGFFKILASGALAQA